MAKYQYNWSGTNPIEGVEYQCGFCGKDVGPSKMYVPPSFTARIYICPTCLNPTFFDNDQGQHPSPKLGRSVNGITDDSVLRLYEEARSCTGAGAFTGAVLLCRKLLMNIAAQHGAPEGDTFTNYITFLEEKGFVPPNGKPWVDKLRKSGNEATHEIRMKDKPEALQIMTFAEMLLRFVYEFPSMVAPEKP